GCIFTYSELGGLPFKIVAAKGYVRLKSGNHLAGNGVGCPISDCYVQVHHYKWVSGIIDRLEPRANDKEWVGAAYTSECKKFVDYYYTNNGRIEVDDPKLLTSECSPEYKYWNQIKDAVKAFKQINNDRLYT